VNPDTLALVESAGFIEAVPQEYQVQCTSCPKSGLILNNPYNVGFNNPMWTLHVHLKDPWTPAVPASAEIFYDDLGTVPLPESAQLGPFGPLSDTFGFNVRLRRP
jgi:hypothetical protein